MLQTDEANAGIEAPKRRVAARAWPTWTDLLLGCGLGLFVAVSPFTPAAWLPSLLAGATGGAAFVGWRVYRRYRQPEVERLEAPGDETARAHGVRVPAVVWPALLAVAVVLAPTCVWLYESWTASIWQNGHGILIPVVMGYMIYATLRRDPRGEAESSAWGFAFLAAGLLLVALDSAVRTHQLAALSLVLTLPGISLLLLGARRTRMLSVPLLLGLFMIPVPNSIAAHFYLKKITAVAVAPLLSGVGIPVFREDTLLVLPNASFLVADACSGFAGLYAAVGISIVLAASARSHLRKVLLLVAAWPLAIACNVARVALLVGAANHYGLDLLDTPFHAASGVATFWAVLLLLFLIADRRALRESYA